MRRRTRLGGLLALLLLGLIVPALLGTAAQAVPKDVGGIEAATGTPFGITAGSEFAPNEQAARALGSKLYANSEHTTAATCNQQSYMQVFDPATGQRLITLAPGNTINVQAFTVLLHQGVVQPNTRAIFFYRWNNNTAGFDYFTTFAEGNCVMRQEPNPLSGQAFPVATQVSVSVCFVPWELGGGTVICGPLGFVNRTF